MSKRKKSSHQLASKTRPVTSVPSAMRLRVLGGAALIIVAVFLAYLPSISGGFIWDDETLLTDNSLIKASDGLYRFWCTTEPYDYWPVVNTTFWIEWRLWGMNPTGYHVTNMILHIIEALLIWLILRKLSIPGAFLAAMIFALHPVNVESVAWIAQRKNTMAMFFFLLSILWYLKFLKLACRPTFPPKGERPLAAKLMPFTVHHPLSTFSSFIFHPSSFYLWYWLSLAAFTLAMLSKGSVAVLPVLLLGIVWWRRPLTRWDLVRTAPFFVVAVVLAGVNVWFQTHGAMEVIRNASLAERLLGAGGVVWFYLYKTLLPVNLIFVYPQWRIEAGNPLWWLPLLAALAVTAVLWWYRGGWSRPLLFAWGFFCVALAPALGLTDVYFMKYSLVADHYQHLALIGAIALAAAGWSVWRQRAQGSACWAANVMPIVVLGTLTLLTWRQSGLYRDAMTLYRATLEKNPDCWMAHNNLGIELVQKNRPQEAIEHYREALRLKAYYPEAHSNLGNALFKTNRPQEAIEQFREALRLKPNLSEAHSNLGNALLYTGRGEEAIEQFREVLRLEFNLPEAHNNLGNAFHQTDRPQEAIEHYRHALRLKPDYPEAHNNLGNALFQMGRPQEAIEHYRHALRLKSDYPEAHNNLGLALLNSGQLPEAIEHCRQALSLKPDYLEAHNCLGLALLHSEQLPEAIEHFQHALRLKPDLAEACANLALAYFKMHQSSEAIATAQKAIELARSKGQIALAKQIEDWLKSYSANRTDFQSAPSSRESDLPAR